MPLLDLLQLADVALGGHSGPQLPEEVLRAAVEETRSRAGVLRRGDEVLARWPRTVSRQVEEATEGWTELPFSSEGRGWMVRLLNVERLDELVLGATRLSLRAWELHEELKRRRFDERFHLWELEAIRAMATGIVGILEVGRLAEELISHLVALLGVRSAHLYLGDGPQSAVSVGGFGGQEATSELLAEAWQHGVYGDEVVALPLQSNGGTLGVLVAAHKEARAGTEPFGSNDMRLLELFAIQVTVAMEYARLSRESLERERLRRELEMAAAIQSHLHPQRFPDFAGFRFAARSTPSRQVAGDTYDILRTDGTLVVTVTDVSGKGVGAGMIAAGVHAGVRLLASEVLGLETLARRINDYLAGATADNRFATFAMVRLEADGGLTAVNAGHCPLVIRRADGRIEQLRSGGLPLGIMEQAPYTSVTSRLDPGDLLLLYTDGLSEAEDAAEEEFGSDRIVDVVAELTDATADGACRELLAAVDEFTDGRPLLDDATLVVVERIADGA